VSEAPAAVAAPLMEPEALRAAILAQPEAVLDDPAVLQALVAAMPTGGRKVTDLRGALVARLETRLKELERTHRSVIAAAYENLAGAQQVHRVVSLLLAQESLGGFLRALLIETPEILAVDVARLCLETGEEAPGPVGDLDAGVGPRVVALPPDAIAAYIALGNTPERDGVWLRRAPAEAELVYGDDAASARSEALVQLDLGIPGHRGLLAFGAEDARRFSAEHGTDLVGFLGTVVALTLRRWLLAR
jgi:uncharacterized protein YigA (DUF484 family)